MARRVQVDNGGGRAAEGAAATYLVLGPVEPPVGGVSRYCRGLAELLETSGNSAVQLDLGKTSSRELGIAHSPLQRIVKRAVGGVAYALRSTVARHRPDLVVDSHEFLWSDPQYAGRLRGIVTCPYVLVIHDGRFPQFVRDGFAPGARWREHLEWASGVICVNDAIRDTLEELVPGIRAARLSPMLEGPPAQGVITQGTDSSLSPLLRSFFQRHDSVITASGALVEHYGLRDLFEAYGVLRTRDKKIGLVLLLGSFARDENAARELSDAVDRWGDSAVLALTDYPAGSSVIARSDVYVRPSRVDGEPLSVYEAMQAGVPVVAARHETRPDGVLLYEPGDIGGLVAALEEAWSPRAKSAAQALAPRIRELVDSNRRETLAFLRSCAAGKA